jgi:hypothetical protein
MDWKGATEQYQSGYDAEHDPDSRFGLKHRLKQEHGSVKQSVSQTISKQPKWA